MGSDGLKSNNRPLVLGLCFLNVNADILSKFFEILQGFTGARSGSLVVFAVELFHIHLQIVNQCLDFAESVHELTPLINVMFSE